MNNDYNNNNNNSNDINDNNTGANNNISANDNSLHPVSVRRFPSFRTQPLDNITPLPMNKWISEQPSPWRKYSKRKSCYGDRVYEAHPDGRVALAGLPPHDVVCSM